MTAWSLVEMERNVAASPIWIQMRDAFTGRAPTGPFTVTLERRVDTDWVPLDYPHQVSPAGDLGFVNLGRTHKPDAVGQFDVRVTVAAPRMIAVAPGGEASITSTVTAWASDSPVSPTEPEILRFFPGPDYGFPAGIPLLAGRVADQGGAPLPGARVLSTTLVLNTPRVEETRTDSDGWFRLPLRWSTGATNVEARLGALQGAIAITVPDDLSTTQQITLT